MQNNTTAPYIVANSNMTEISKLQIQRNNRRLGAHQQQERTITKMDQATQATLAVYISNLVFGVPHAIFHLMDKQSLYLYVIFHVIYSTHFLVDPLAYMWFNAGCREKILSSVRKVTQP